MTFGKPQLTDKEVRCIECGEQYPEHEATLHHAGRVTGGTPHDGDYWNTKCPECGTMDSMHERYAGMTEEEFEREQEHIAQLRMEAKQRARESGA